MVQVKRKLHQFIFYKSVSWDSGVVICPIIRNIYYSYISILLYTKILEVNLFASACTLFHRDFSPINGAYLPLVIPEYIRIVLFQYCSICECIEVNKQCNVMYIRNTTLYIYMKLRLKIRKSGVQLSTLVMCRSVRYTLYFTLPWT